MLETADLQTVEKTDYPVHEGNFVDEYSQMARSSFILRADFPLDRMADFLGALDDRPSLSKVFLDFGCGRLLAGLEGLSDDDWAHLCEKIDQHSGHGLLVKAPDDFRQRNDVFGRPRTEWKVMHRIKAAMDPDNIFFARLSAGKSIILIERKISIKASVDCCQWSVGVKRNKMQKTIFMFPQQTTNNTH